MHALHGKIDMVEGIKVMAPKRRRSSWIMGVEASQSLKQQKRLEEMIRQKLKLETQSTGKLNLLHLALKMEKGV